MSGFLDTNVIVRYLTGDPPSMAEQAAKILANEPDLSVTDVVIAEVDHVLSSVYRVPREMIVDHLITLMQRSNITPFGLPKDVVIQGLMMCRPSGRVSIPDAMIWAAARSSTTRLVYTFDRRFPSDGVSLRRSPE
jgi:predicted nucleic-acid-binding protein